MLENEPDNDSPSTAGDQAGPGTTLPRRRRAASRPAGPPAPVVAATAPQAPVIEQAPAAAQLDAPPLALPPVDTQAEVPAPQPESPTVEAPGSASQVEVPASEVSEISGPTSPPAKKAAAKRAPRKATAKKAAGPPASEAAAADGEPAEVAVQDALVAAPVKRAPRKRATKKTATPETGVAAVESDASATLVPAATPAAEVALSAPSAPSAPPGAEVAPTAEPTTEGPAGWVAPADPEVASETAPAPLDVDGQDLVPPTAADVDLASVPTEQPRDFGWLADPFAVPAAPEPPPVAEAGAASVADHVEATVGETDGQADDLAGPSTSAAETEAAETSTATAEDDESGDGSNRRRRRRRGGRRRRRGAGGDEDSGDLDSDDESDGDAPSAANSTSSAESSPAKEGTASSLADSSVADGGDAEDTTGDDGADENDGEDSEGQRRRRRRRRRRGEEAPALPDDPTDVVVRVREPRTRRKSASTEVTGIEGSTRMEAKRQRRKEGRDAGRRRAPILSESEFLARRESVNRKMIIRQRQDSSSQSGGSLAQIAVLEDGILVEHYVDRDSAASLIGNVYLGRVQNVLPSMEAAFVDIGRGRNAVLYAGEVDWDSFGAEGHNRKVEKVFKSGQMILVQVSKDPVGAKGARLTNHVSLPGRYVVYAPGGHLSGISRKLPDVERRRLKDILADLVGAAASVIVRTAAEGASEEELVRDVNRLRAQWEDIERKVKAGNSPQLLYGEPDLTVRIVRDLFTEDFSELIIQGNETMNDAYDAIQGYVTHVAPHLQERIRRWEPNGDEDDLFATYRLDEQIAKALERKVFLPSGGSLVIDRTEAMTVIDVNTGKFTGTGGNLEATVTSNNLEAAEEIVNQLRLRDIGGIIVIDFIDMVLPSNRELLLRRLVECLGRDRTRHQVAEVTSLGLVQMTRKKIGTGLLEAFGTECPHCLGRGFLLHDTPVDTQKQADGGARESRGPNHRPRPGDGQRGPRPGGGREPGAGRDSNASRDRGAQDNSSKDDGSKDDGSSPDHGSRGNGSREREPVGVGGPEPSSGDEQPDRGRSRRGRRGGRGASAGRELDEPSTEQPDDRVQTAAVEHDSAQATPRHEEPGQQDQGQGQQESLPQDSGQQESNRAYYDEREQASERADLVPSERAQAELVPSDDQGRTTSGVTGESDHQDDA